MNHAKQSPGVREYFTGNLEFDEATHTYTVDGKELTSVTQFLKQFFPFDANQIAEKVSKDERSKYYGKDVQDILDVWESKANHGTDVHKLMEDYINGEFVTISSPKHARAFEYAQKLDYEFDELYPEVQIYSTILGLAGTIDLLAKKGSKWYIIDWKTDKTIRRKSYNGEKCEGLLFEWDKCNFNKYIFQLGIYRYILEQKYGILISGIRIVHFQDMKSVEYQLPYPIDYIDLILTKKWQKEKEKEKEK